MLCAQSIKCDTALVATFSIFSKEYTLTCGNCRLQRDWFYCYQEAQPVKSLYCTSSEAGHCACNNVSDGIERIIVNPSSYAYAVAHMTIFVNDQLKEEAHRKYRECTEKPLHDFLKEVYSDDFGLFLLLLAFSCSLVFPFVLLVLAALLTGTGFLILATKTVVFSITKKV